MNRLSIVRFEKAQLYHPKPNENDLAIEFCLKAEHAVNLPSNKRSKKLNGLYETVTPRCTVIKTFPPTLHKKVLCIKSCRNRDLQKLGSSAEQSTMELRTVEMASIRRIHEAENRETTERHKEKVERGP